MSTAPTINHPAYYADYQNLRQQLSGSSPSWLNDLRAAAWERFDASGFPTARRGNEPWKYTNVRPIAQGRFDSPASGKDPEALLLAEGNSVPSTGFEPEWLTLIFVDGKPVVTPETRPGIVGTLAPALTEGGDGPTGTRENLGHHATIAEDAFVALNTAFLNDGACVSLPDDYDEEVFLNLVYVQDSPDSVNYPRTLIVAGRNTRLTVFESYISVNSDNAPQYFTNAVTEVAVGEGARVTHYRLLNESRNAYHVGSTRVTQARDSSYEAGSFAMGCSLGRHDLSVLLDGTGANCSLNGLYLTDNTEHMDNLVSIDHAHPHGTSRLYYKGILDGRSRAVFGGTVLVREDAQKTDAQQTDKNLILSDRAEVDSKPSLLIYADDVKCGHGATAGHIDDDTLFYMQSRGIDPQTASQILIHAFASEIIETVSSEPVRDYLDRLFLETVSGKTISGLGGRPVSPQRQGGA
ncbi:MAG: Fe-S cluster assembly protein SufD [Chloroflexi bacterium]|nr:Fe-S cluster assembly protein SufD [Chloroflexota bacterium]